MSSVRNYMYVCDVLMKEDMRMQNQFNFGGTPSGTSNSQS